MAEGNYVFVGVIRKKRFATKWEIRSTEKEDRWEQNYELLKLKDKGTPADTYGSSSASSDDAVKGAPQSGDAPEPFS